METNQPTIVSYAVHSSQLALVVLFNGQYWDFVFRQPAFPAIDRHAELATSLAESEAIIGDRANYTRSEGECATWITRQLFKCTLVFQDALHEFLNEREITQDMSDEAHFKAREAFTGAWLQISNNLSATS